MRKLTPILAVLIVAAGVLACEQARGAPDAPLPDAAVQEASDTTAVLQATWGQVSPPADVWRYRLEVAGDSAETDSTGLSEEIERRDSTYSETVCVRGVAQRAGEEAVGGEGCASVEVPPAPLEAPGTPSPDASVDTTAETASAPDMPSDLQLAEVSRTDSTVTYRATWTCVEGADQYVVRAGTNDGSRTFLRDTLDATSCVTGEPASTLVMATERQ